MPNPNRDRGMRAEREACKLLTDLTGFPVQRMANQGIPLDVGDLYGIPDTTVQVSAVNPLPARIWDRARQKTGDCTKQQERHGMRHGVVLLRIDGGTWRALTTTPQLLWLAGDRDYDNTNNQDRDVTPGAIIRWAPYWAPGWSHVGLGIWVATLGHWATDITTAVRPVEEEVA